jgi:hypothetical protein
VKRRWVVTAEGAVWLAQNPRLASEVSASVQVRWSLMDGGDAFLLGQIILERRIRINHTQRVSLARSGRLASFGAEGRWDPSNVVAVALRSGFKR